MTPPILTRFGNFVVTMPSIIIQRIPQSGLVEIEFGSGNAVMIELTGLSEREMQAKEARQRHFAARGPGSRKRRTKVDSYPFKVLAPVKHSYAVDRSLTVWCRDNAVGKHRLDNNNDNDNNRRFHFADETDAVMFQIFAGGVRS